MDTIETLNRYQVEALRTAASYPDPTKRKTILTLGLAGESGEFVDAVKKELGHGHEPNLDVVAAELGDILWYVANMADAYGFSLSEIATRNIAKLRARYPDGFSQEASVNRATAQ